MQNASERQTKIATTFRAFVPVFLFLLFSNRSHGRAQIMQGSVLNAHPIYDQLINNTYNGYIVDYPHAFVSVEMSASIAVKLIYVILRRKFVESKHSVILGMTSELDDSRTLPCQ